MEEGLIAENPAARLKQPRLKRGEPKAASMEDLLKLLDATKGESPLALRNRAMLLVLADTACRVGGGGHAPLIRHFSQRRATG
jgi:site-specific recombinase XerD